jgi:hypothetical protein
MKRKLVELHRERAYTGLTMAFTVHDEVDGTHPASDPGVPARVAEVLNEQSFTELKVPILWDVEVGPNWAECREPEPQMGGLEETRARLHYVNTGRNRP